MKRLIRNTALLLAAVAAGCTDTEEIRPEAPESPAFLTLSNEKVIFDIEGGRAAIVVATNVEAWEYAAEGDWFAVTRQDDHTLLVETAINAAPDTQTGSLTVTGRSRDEELSATVRLVQRAERSINLSADGTANCYIARTNSAYKFLATVKGNGKGDGRTRYIATEGVGIDQIASADLIWESRHDGDRTMSREIIEGAPLYRNGYVSFTTGRSEGNALIAVKNLSGKILWSWHIWVCDDPIGSHDHIDTEGNVAAQIMDRNLGALNNTPMDVRNRGMLYQWGRKDPFMPSSSPYHEDTNGSNIPAYNVTNYEVGNGSGQWNFQTKALPIETPPGNIAHACENPMDFLLPYYSQGTSHWYSTGSGDEIYHSQLWASEKTIFDPCPPGYKVPGRNLWGLPSGNTSIKTGGPVEDYDENGQNPQWNWNVCKDCGRCWKPTGDFYPMTGNIYYSSTTETNHNYAGGLVFYWTTHESPEDRPYAYSLSFNNYWAYYDTRAEIFTGQIRCIKE